MATIHNLLIDFDIADEKGRAVGALVIVNELIDGVHVTYNDADGRFEALCQAARNGKGYGASGSRSRHMTQAQALAAANARAGVSRKRYAKKYAA